MRPSGQDGARAQPGLATEAKGKGRMGKGFDMKVPGIQEKKEPWNLGHLGFRQNMDDMDGTWMRS